MKPPHPTPAHPLLFVALTVLFLSRAAHGALPGNPEDPASPVPEAIAVRITDGVVLDGRLDDEAWAAATPITDFVQTEPHEAEPATEPTEVRVLFDDDAIYIGARLHDRGPIASRLGRRDTYMVESDYFSVSLDTYHDHQTAFHFGVYPSGVKRDIAISPSGDDATWDPIWDVATTIDATGWTVEMRIPLSQLRFTPGPAQVWGIQISRRIARNRETAVFSFTPKSERGGVARYGHLTGLDAAPATGRLEVVPYAVGKAEFLNVEAGNPFRGSAEYRGTIGADLKYGLTSNLTLNATVNPDFGQVEADPAQLNLSAYETRFGEKRPFFIEGAEIFRGGANLFYSRRIGRKPQGSLPDEAEYHDSPAAAAILAAAKLTGRTANGWSVGVLDAVTARTEARYVDAQGRRGRTVVEPRSNYFVARARRAYRNGQTTVGGMLTATHRDLETEALSDQLRSSAYVGGLDFDHEFADRTWLVRGHAAYSHIVGRSPAIVAAQRTSARYYQRPDAHHLEVDSAATSLTGYKAELEIAKRAGLHWRGDARVSATSPGYEINDLGFQSAADRLSINGGIAYVENRPGDLFRDWRINLWSHGTWNYGHDFLGSRVSIAANGQLLNYWGGGLNFSHDFAALDDRLTRGGPLAEAPARNSISFNISSDSRKPVTFRLSGNRAWGESGAWQHGGSLNLGLKLSDQWSLNIAPSFERSLSAAQYLTTIDDTTALETFGRRYVFAELERTSLSVDTRLNVTFSPDLTLELYAQPYFSTGDYGRPFALRTPRSFDFEQYDGEVDDDDFNYRSLRGNAVMRWEWRPGSTLFLVWQQNRSARDEIGDFDLGRDAGTLLHARPENVFQVKMSYWLAP